MKVLVILGNRMNDDGTISDIMRARLQSALRAYKLFKPERIIVSGGVANKKAGIAEAEKMFAWLTENGVPKEEIIKEGNSLTTLGNAKYSTQIANSIGADTIILCTSTYHVARTFHNAAALFQKSLADYPKIKLTVFTEE